VTRLLKNNFSRISLFLNSIKLFYLLPCIFEKESKKLLREQRNQPPAKTKEKSGSLLQGDFFRIVLPKNSFSFTGDVVQGKMPNYLFLFSGLSSSVSMIVNANNDKKLRKLTLISVEKRLQRILRKNI